MKGGKYRLARPKENTDKINVFIPHDALESLKLEASKKGMTVSGFVRMLILEYLDEKKKTS